jgi:hypothetical protein
LEKVGFPSNHLAAGENNLAASAPGIYRGKKAKNWPGRRCSEQSTQPAKHGKEKFPPLRRWDLSRHASSLETILRKPIRWEKTLNPNNYKASRNSFNRKKTEFPKFDHHSPLIVA